MIIGRGDIASVLTDRDDFCFFASGVSNSQEIRESEYQRERNLLLSQDRHRHLVYMSSLCIFYSNSRYSIHKRDMESLVREKFKHYAILRLGNITWGNNPHTLLNFLAQKIRNNEPFEIRNVYRYVVSLEEFLYWIDLIPKWNCEMNIVGTRMKIIDIVDQLRGMMISTVGRSYARITLHPQRF